MAKKRVLGIFAHGDDEVLFGWPYLQNDEYERHVLIAALDVLPCISDQSMSYHISHRCEGDAPEVAWREGIEDAIEVIDPDIIVTHNPWGEYGHPDHIALHTMLVVNYPDQVRWADIVAKSIVWELPDLDMTAAPMRNIKLDVDWFNQGKAIYEAAGAWTTNQFLMNPNSGHIRDGVTIRYNSKTPDSVPEILWVVETLGWAWFKRAMAMIRRMPKYAHRVMWAVDGRKIEDLSGDADVVVVCHPSLLPHVPKDKKALLIGSSVRSFEQCLS